MLFPPEEDVAVVDVRRILIWPKGLMTSPAKQLSLLRTEYLFVPYYSVQSHVHTVERAISLR